MVWSWQVSSYLLISCVVVVLALLAVGVPTSNWFLGSSIATILVPRFFVVIFILALFLSRLNILLLTAIGSLLLSFYFHLTLQEIWKELGVKPDFMRDVLRMLFPFLVALTAIHVVWGASKSKRS